MSCLQSLIGLIAIEKQVLSVSRFSSLAVAVSVKLMHCKLCPFVLSTVRSGSVLSLVVCVWNWSNLTLLF